MLAASEQTAAVSRLVSRQPMIFNLNRDTQETNPERLLWKA